MRHTNTNKKHNKTKISHSTMAVAMAVHPRKSSAVRRAATSPPRLLVVQLLSLASVHAHANAFAFGFVIPPSAARVGHGGGNVATTTSTTTSTTELRATRGGGMDAYAAQMAAMARAGGGSSPSPSPLPDAAASPPADAAISIATASAADRTASDMLDAARSTISAATSAFVGVGITVDASTAISMLESSQTLLVSRIKTSIPDLASRPDACSSPDFVVGPGTDVVKLRAYDAPGPSNVAWLSDLSVDGRLSSLAIYSGPLTCVPHLLSRCSIDANLGDLRLFLDFRPRSYGAYEMRDPFTGEYPGPETLGRKSFEYSGSRMEYGTRFGNADVAGYLNGVRTSLVGAFDNPTLGDGELSEMETLTRGPLALDVTMPLRWVPFGTFFHPRSFFVPPFSPPVHEGRKK